MSGSIDMVITSRDNGRIREILKRKRDLSKGSETVFIEGLRLCVDAYRSGVFFETLILTEDALPSVPADMTAAAGEILAVSPEIAARISSTVNPQGIFGIVRSPMVTDWGDAAACPGERLILCDSVRDPGNFGSIIRSADAFGFDGVVFTSDSADPFNEKAVRGSMGSVFHIRLIHAPSMERTVEALKKEGFTVYSAALDGDDLTDGFRFTGPCAILVGNEARGVSERLSACADRNVRIPMRGGAESLNVASAAAILMFLASGDFAERAGS